MSTGGQAREKQKDDGVVDGDADADVMQVLGEPLTMQATGKLLVNALVDYCTW